ncbi:Protein CBG22392 [Caenorhabditis briggsae]|uniref:Protein CBG22392 n=1 Tax=Caenorhabditis briggsae TaxID=6238 RepID=A8Y250_CAEBR|nr:Protein CBG22392 [Caenorhabditis briggsae]CAP38990.1 Protein CBG22392 [Caenorhabditis briggsae]
MDERNEARDWEIHLEVIERLRMEDEREWYENMSRARAEWQARIREPVLPVTPHPLGRMGIEFGDEELVVPILPPGKNCNFKLWTHFKISETRTEFRSILQGYIEIGYIMLKGYID